MDLQKRSPTLNMGLLNLFKQRRTRRVMSDYWVTGYEAIELSAKSSIPRSNAASASSTVTVVFGRYSET